MEDEVGNFQTDDVPTVKGSLAQKRMEERAKKAAEQKARLAAMKKTVKPAGTTTAKARPAAFNKSSLNTNFFANAKTNKDKAQGWAYDFENQEAVKKEDAMLQKALQESLDEV